MCTLFQVWEAMCQQCRISRWDGLRPWKQGQMWLFSEHSAMELDLNHLSEGERQMVETQVAFMKKHRRLIQQGRFYRLKSPFADSESAWIVVSEDRREALAGYYRMAKTTMDPGKDCIWLALKSRGNI